MNSTVPPNAPFAAWRTDLDDVPVWSEDAGFPSWRAARRGFRKGFASITWRLDGRIPALRSFLVRGLTIFIFHDITDSPSPMQRQFGIFTPPDLFERQIQWLQERFTLIKPLDLLNIEANRALPENAALVTLDDSWAGIFRVGLPLLEQMEVPSLTFINMATIGGDPDLAAVRGYEQLCVRPEDRILAGPIDVARSGHVMAMIRERYATRPEYLAYQGSTATADDLAKIASTYSYAWFGSQLYHHWEIWDITPDLYQRSLEENLEALSVYPNTTPIAAVPGGHVDGDHHYALSLPQRLGYRVVMTATGRQNSDTHAEVLDRLPLPILPSGARDWWHAAHRQRLLGWALREP